MVDGKGRGQQEHKGTASALCQHCCSTKKTSAMTKLHEASSEHAVEEEEEEETTECPASPQI